MPVTVDPNGKRWISAEVEVPGTPEEVWAAIATGPGISAWFVPTELEERAGGTTVSHFGPGNTMDGTATITDWEPPHRFAAESRDDLDPDDPTVATEWSVEAKAGGTCTVRIVHSWFWDKADWDEQFEGHSHGWNAFFRILKLYLTHFAGKKRSGFNSMGAYPGTVQEAWGRLAGALGLANLEVGKRWSAPAGAPRLSGDVLHLGPAEFPEVLLLLGEPDQGLADIVAFDMGGMISVQVRLYLYGDEAVSDREQPKWDAWLAGLYPAPAFEAEPAG